MTDEELDRLAELLDCRDGAMNVEAVDGFFAALICCPDLVPLSEYLPHVLGGGKQWEDLAEAQAGIELLMKLWNSIAASLNEGGPHAPLLSEDEAGNVFGNDWAYGFTRAMRLRSDHWAPLLNDDDQGGLLVPILALAHEHDPDPQMRPYKEPMSDEQRKKLLNYIATGLPQIFDYFRNERWMGSPSRTVKRSAPKIGRNDPCPCGSGKKYKKCCGAATLH